jgi:hypothetical protein
MTARAARATSRPVNGLTAFCAPDGPEVFGTIVHTNQVWTPDPFDVVTIHAEARESFAALVNRAVARPAPEFGKSLLLLGEAGSGKTHLMRAFRNRVHEEGVAYCGYLQMTTRSENYARYVLSNLIDSLGWPYCPPAPASGLSRLAAGLVDALEGIAPGQHQRLRDPDLDPAGFAALVHEFADVAVQDPRFGQIDLDVLRAVLYLLSGDGRVRQRVLKWLRCEDLSRFDRGLLGDLVPRPQEHMPLRTIIDLGRLMAAVHGAALVLCVDQLEEMIDQSPKDKDPGEVFRRVVDTLVALTSAIPTAVVVVACLEDYFTAARDYLAKPKLDRLERDPEPVRLAGARTRPEVEALIARRLEVLYDAFHLTPYPDMPAFPFQPGHLDRLAGKRTRDVLDWCRQHQERCVRARRWVEPEDSPLPPPGRKEHKPDPGALAFEQLWNDFLAGYQTPVLDDEAERARLLAWVIRAVSAELPDGLFFGVEADGRFLPVELHGPDNTVEKLLVAVCDKDPRGGGLGKQVEEVARRAGDVPAVVVRSSPFPSSPGTLVSQQLAKLIAPKGKGRRVMVEGSDWRAMAAFRAFHGQHQGEAAFTAWQRRERPLTELPAVRDILALDKLPAPGLGGRPKSSPPPPVPEERPERRPPPPPPPPAPPQPLLLGRTRGLAPAEVRIEPRELTQHAAFLGGSGSGKTTAALTLIEQLLPYGVPAVLIDRKGDLARYADPEVWAADDADPSRAEARRRLKERVDVALFTPGATRGRPLGLPLAPPDLHLLPEAEREQLCKYAAAALGGMMGYRPKGIDPKMAILGKAIEVLAGVPGQEVTVRRLQQLIEDQDEALLLAVGGFESRHYRKLAEDLLALSLQRQRLLEGSPETLDVDSLLGRGAHARPGKTRLAVINVQFLGGSNAVDFWLAQFLIALGRWAARNPSPTGNLQAVLLLDEADQYLPATRQPATKGPMENLLRRARSAGLGLFLASQSPGDFDYKCRDQVRLWLIGRVKEPVAIGKLKPMLEAGQVDAAAKLPGQGTGQFFLVREREVLAVQTEPSLIATRQLPEDRIQELARTTGPSSQR